MNIRYFFSHITNSDIILLITAVILTITAVILLYTYFATKKSIRENERLNRLQAAENTIIKQIEFHYNILNGIKVKHEGTGGHFSDKPQIAHGQDAFEIFYFKLSEIYSRMSSYFEDSVAGEEKRITDSFIQLYNWYGSQFGNYFKNLYLLISYIDALKIKDFNTGYYIDLVKSQLSKYEILLLAYDCIWIQDKDKNDGKNFIQFAKKYNLLSALEKNELIKSKSPINHTSVFDEHYGIVFS